MLVLHQVDGRAQDRVNNVHALFFFFQAEDGIRDHCVTGVQTYALPISSMYVAEEQRQLHEHIWQEGKMIRMGETGRQLGTVVLAWDAVKSGAADAADGKNVVRSEERRVGKECRSRWSRYQ